MIRDLYSVVLACIAIYSVLRGDIQQANFFVLFIILNEVRTLQKEIGKK